MTLLEDFTNLQLQNQQIENDFIDSIMDMQDIDEAPFMKDEEE